MAKRKGARQPRIAVYSLYGPSDRFASKAVVAIFKEDCPFWAGRDRWTGELKS